MISAILLAIMRDEGFSLDTLSFLSQFTLVIAGFTFVDNTDITNATKLVYTRGDDLLTQQKYVAVT